jgi:hypothetical protein
LAGARERIVLRGKHEGEVSLRPEKIHMTTRADFKSGYAPSDGAKIYFESAGAGPAVVFVHAGSEDVGSAVRVFCGSIPGGAF